MSSKRSKEIEEKINSELKTGRRKKEEPKPVKTEKKEKKEKPKQKKEEKKEEKRDLIKKQSVSVTIPRKAQSKLMKAAGLITGKGDNLIEFKVKVIA